MYVVKVIVKWGWCPVLITAVAVVAVTYDWPLEAVVPVLVILLIIGLIVAIIGARERELHRSSLKLRQMVGYFNRRFMGDSSLSIFAIIDSLFNIDNPRLWEWARTYDIARRIFNTWCNSFMGRAESDIRAKKFDTNLRNYINELWLVNNHYFEFIEQFYEVAEKIEIPRETIGQYNRFVMEYNAFVNDFRDNIGELRKTFTTEIEPPSVKLARELPEVKPVQPSQEGETKPPQTGQHKGYYL